MVKALFIGAVHEALPAFDALCASDGVEIAGVVTLDVENGASGAIDLAALAAARGITSHILPDANCQLLRADLEKFAADVAFVVGWNRLIPEAVLDMFPLGAYGFHASALPKDRGRAPVNWAIIRGYTSTANTMMRLSPGVDLGDIVDQRFTPIFPDDTCGTVYERLAGLGATMIAENLQQIVDERLAFTPQTPSEGNNLPKRTSDMGVLDWSMTPVEVHNWIRALTTPYPGAFSELAGRRVRLWKSDIPSMTTNGHADHMPGTILEIDPEGVLVQVGLGTIRLRDLTWDDGVPLDHVQCLRVGDSFCRPAEDWAHWAKGLGAKPELLRFEVAR